MRLAKTTLVVLGALLVLAGSAPADSTSYTGMLANSTETLFAGLHRRGGIERERHHPDLGLWRWRECRRADDCGRRI
jgi:hypothetical protein